MVNAKPLSESEQVHERFPTLHPQRCETHYFKAAPGTTISCQTT